MDNYSFANHSTDMSSTDMSSRRDFLIVDDAFTGRGLNYYVVR
jgi:hypothetical protein